MKKQKLLTSTFLLFTVLLLFLALQITLGAATTSANPLMAPAGQTPTATPDLRVPWDALPGVAEQAVIAAEADSGKPGLSAGTAVSAEEYQQLIQSTLDRKQQAQASAAAANAAPIITIWYGDNQKFGQIGQPIEWINILGNITGTSSIVSLTYSLNGGASFPLAIGPDTKRLLKAGDFNVEIAYTALKTGANQVAITGIDAQNRQTTRTVTVTYDDGNSWPTSYTVDWNLATNIQDVAQVVDGKWALQNGKLVPQELGYDRLVAIGDITWTDYEVVVPVTIHGIDPAGFNSPSNGPGVGLILRWQGHFNENGEQPNTGWQKLGALGWFRWNYDQYGALLAGLQMYGTGGGEIAVNPKKQAAANTTYWMKMSVQSLPGKPAYYRFKTWKSDEPEPLPWDMQGFSDTAGPATGSMLLVAHHVDASFGPVTVQPITDLKPSLNTFSNGNGSIVVSPNAGEYSYGQSVSIAALGEPGYKLSNWSGDATGNVNPLNFDLTKDTVITATFIAADPPTITKTDSANGRILISPTKSIYLYGEKITVTALPSPGYMLANWAGDLLGKKNPTVLTLSSDLVINAAFAPAQAPFSDDFNRCALDTNRWTFRDPVGDVTLSTTGKRLLLTLPAGSDHDLWTDKNFAPRLMQAAENKDFTLEVKFESPLTQQYQMQGLLVEQDNNNFLRFEFYSDGTNLRILAASFISGTGTIRTNQVIMPSGTDTYMQVERSGDQWTQSYSMDGVNWTVAGVFTHSLTVTATGLHAANTNAVPANTPAHTAIVDYFFNTAAPILPEDNRSYALTVKTVGSGTAAPAPNQPSYVCGDQITLTATPAAGSIFSGWSGALSGNTNPAVLSFDVGSVVTATFVSAQQTFTLNVTATNGAVSVSPQKTAYQAGEKVTLTATPQQGWRFVGWSGDLTGSSNPAELTMTKNSVVTAQFEEITVAKRLFLPLARKP